VPKQQPSKQTDAPKQMAEEREEIWNLRPRTLDECIGQTAVIEAMRIAIQAARQRGEPLDHTLFYGPPGLGKTTFARIIANELGVQFKGTSGPALERGGDLVSILTNLEQGDVLFIDEVHRLPKTVEELLYPAMEDFSVNFVIDKGLHARTLKYQLVPFTLVAATTRPGMLSAPLRDASGSSTISISTPRTSCAGSSRARPRSWPPAPTLTGPARSPGGHGARRAS
jgi:Holliday junction DNA helicase RuvB